jgi:hypothetical protein
VAKVKIALLLRPNNSANRDILTLFNADDYEVKSISHLARMVSPTFPIPISIFIAFSASLGVVYMEFIHLR